ncbi:hypothetical protein, variant [Verruconis gallopava]|uniref:Uncharacterized protein n=1 Tax=Verruconis gallopava TaxID=253628 RepID=A0A0D2AJL4_9PEZI|nr:hypothetical protein, variant [Verruconis gallopava]KIV99123.1 hypothetical protein, variant [Verruconis gallopava]
MGGRPTKRRRVANPSEKPEAESSLLFKLPLELRLHIYNYALNDVTITVADQGQHIHNPANDLCCKIEGLPLRYVPLVTNTYSPDNMMIGPPKALSNEHMRRSLDMLGMNNSGDNSITQMSMDSGYSSATNSIYSNLQAATINPSFSNFEGKLDNVQSVTNISLLRINSQIRNEMLTHLQSRMCTRTTLYVTYPYGLLVLRHHYPALLRYAKSVVITGTYESTKTLRQLANALFSSYRKVTPATFYDTMPTLNLRIFFPDERRYSSVWGETGNPIVAAMQLVPAGYIETKTWRARLGNGVTLKAGPPKTEGETKWTRSVSSAFRRLKAPRPLCSRYRRNKKSSEDFWMRSFGDEEMFERDVPEERCWNRA